MLFFSHLYHKGNLHIFKTFMPGGGLELFFNGVCGPQSLKPLPISKDFSPSKKQLNRQFFWNFHKSRPISKGFFSASKMADFKNFSQILWNEPSSKDFFWPKWDSCLRIFGEKVTHIPICLSMWVPPPPSIYAHIRAASHNCCIPI